MVSLRLAEVQFCVISHVDEKVIFFLLSQTYLKKAQGF